MNRQTNIMILQFELVIIIFLSSVLISCYSSRNYIPKDDDNAFLWLNIYHKTWEVPDFYKIGTRIDYFIVPENLKSEYIGRLEYMPYVELEEDEYLRLTGKNMEKNHCFAVRAVRAHRGGQRQYPFTVLINNENVYFIHYRTAGSRVWEIAKEVLIIEADELPREIYIEYNVFR